MNPVPDISTMCDRNVRANARRIGDGGAGWVAALLTVSLIGELAIFGLIVHAALAPFETRTGNNSIRSHSATPAPDPATTKGGAA